MIAGECRRERTVVEVKTSTMLERSRRELADQVPKGELVDARDVVVDLSLPPEERVRSYIRQIGNPYRFRVGDVEVRVRFAGEATLDECLAHYAEHLYAVGRPSVA